MYKRVDINNTNSKMTTYFIGYDLKEIEDMCDKENNSKYAYNSYRKYIGIKENVSSYTHTFLYLNRELVSKCVNKNPEKFSFMLKNPYIKRYIR